MKKKKSGRKPLYIKPIGQMNVRIGGEEDRQKIRQLERKLLRQYEAK